MARGKCGKCEAPVRELWPPVAHAPTLRTVDKGTWMLLVECPACRALWCVVPWEPHASFPYGVLWPASAPTWRELHDRDDGTALHRWHDRRARRLSTDLGPEDASAVRWHQKRSLGRSPIDGPAEPGPDSIEDFLLNGGPTSTRS